MIDLTVTYLDLKVKFLRGFADRTRLAILETLRQGEKSVGELVAATGASQSNVSQHLACLKGCGIVHSRQEGRFSYYSLRDSEIAAFMAQADRILGARLQEILDCPETDRLIGEIHK
ncbi:MAG: metalloregulator ArsR/SmtB family transcription factor [Thermaerobacterales bacterium]